MKSIPGPKTPALLQKIQSITNSLNFLESCAQKYGDIFTATTTLGQVVLVSHPQAIQEIWTKKNEYEAPPIDVYKLILGEDSILVLSGDRHLRERKLLMPSFHGDRMRNYGELICDITKNVASNLTVRDELMTLLYERLAYEGV